MAIFTLVGWELPHGELGALASGGASFSGYALVVWAFTQAPIALVTALRETSIVFALLIGVVFLKERLDIGKVFSTFVTLCGAALIPFFKSRHVGLFGTGHLSQTAPVRRGPWG